jgi:hypothetical protein
MAKKKIPIKEKLHFKKPVKDCGKAIDDIVRVRNNEQAKLRRLKKKFDSIPRGKQKKEADKLRKEIKLYDNHLYDLKFTIGNIRSACNSLDKNKAKIKSAKLKADAINRKMHKMPRKEVGGPEFKRLQNEYLKHAKAIKELQAANTDVLYRVNKGLGFKPETIAERFNINKTYLKKHHEADFEEEYFEETEEIEILDELTGTGGFEGEEVESEGEIEDSDYLELVDSVFWQASQDFTKNESFALSKYDSVIIEYGSSVSYGGSGTFKGTSLSFITMKFSEMVQWASIHEPYIRVVKLVSRDQKKLKYIGYWDQDGRPL